MSMRYQVTGGETGGGEWWSKAKAYGVVEIQKLVHIATGAEGACDDEGGETFPTKLDGF